MDEPPGLFSEAVNHNRWMRLLILLWEKNGGSNPHSFALPAQLCNTEKSNSLRDSILLNDLWHQMFTFSVPFLG